MLEPWFETDPGAVQTVLWPNAKGCTVVVMNLVVVKRTPVTADASHLIRPVNDLSAGKG